MIEDVSKEEVARNLFLKEIKYKTIVKNSYITEKSYLVPSLSLTHLYTFFHL